MKKALAALLAVAGLAWWLARPQPETALPSKYPAVPASRDTSTDVHLSRDPVPLSLNDRAFAVLQAGNRESVLSLAAEWRKSARGDASFRSRLIDLHRDTSAATKARMLAALVLGSLPDREAVDALASSLQSSTDAAWTRTLLLALGSDKSSGTDDDIFGLSGSPRAVETSIGLAIRIKGAIGEASLRSPMTSRLREAGDAGVRWAAAAALTDSAGFEDTRRAFLEALPGETEPAAQGQVAKALAEWVAGASSESADRQTVVEAIFTGALRPDGGALRLRSEDGLKRMAWTEPDVRTIATRIEAGDFDQRRWALAVLSGATSNPGLPARGVVFESLARVVAGEADAKLRELAVTALSSFADQPQASRLLVGKLADPAWHVRAAAVRALGRMGRSEENQAALRQAEREDADERVRRAAAQVLKAQAPK